MPMIYLVKYWKEILMAVLLIIIIAITCYVNNLKADRDAAKVKITNLEKSLVTEKENTAQYKKAVDLKSEELSRYVATQRAINEGNNEIEIKYEKLLSRYNNSVSSVKVKQVETKPTTIVTVKDGVEHTETKCFLNSIEQDLMIFPSVDANTPLYIGQEVPEK